MEPIPRRTNTSSLTDDELILFDVMFDAWVPFRLLRREIFSAQWNVKRPHSLSDAELRQTVERLVTSKLLRTKSRDTHKYLGLTQEGGQLWETERLPTWHRYATERHLETPSGKDLVTITATSSRIRDESWDIGRAVGMYAHSTGRVRTALIKNHELIPWKSFPNLYVLVAVVDDWFPSTDWKAFEVKRTWWRTPRENEKFW